MTDIDLEAVKDAESGVRECGIQCEVTPAHGLKHGSRDTFWPLGIDADCH